MAGVTGWRGEATVMIREQAANEWREHWPLRAEGVSGVRIMTTGAWGDEDDMNTEARHGHGDDMTHDNRHDHTCPDTRQYNLLAPETEVISDWQRGKLLPHPAHSSVQGAERDGRQMRGSGCEAWTNYKQKL